MRLRNVLLFASVIGAILMISCNSESKFHVKGHFASVSDQTIYLEHRALSGIQIVDSAVLGSDGNFKLKGDVPLNPEFYQLRVGGKSVVFVVEGEENLVVVGDFNNLHKTFVVENSIENEQLKKVDMGTLDAKAQIDALEKKHSDKQIDDLEYLNSLDSVLTAYKLDMSNIILGNPSGAAAYYAVFQKINNYLVFDPYDKKDYQMYGAVATSWDKNYSETDRAKHLYDFTMNALKVRKQQEQQAKMIENASVVTNLSLPDINLKDVSGKSVALSSLKGKVVVLDFTVYNSEFSPKHNIALNNAYKQLKDSGVEIYQISFDSDGHFWKNAASNLPWITVHEPESVYSRLLSTYNVREVPTAFILNKEGDIVTRVENYGVLIQEVKKLM